MEFNIGCIQLNSSHDIQENIQKLGPLLEKAHDQKCDILLLPENVSKMPLLDASYAYVEEESIFLSYIQQCALKYKMCIIIGSLPIKSAHPNKCFNRSYVVSLEGKIIAKYDKIHLFKAQINQTYYDESEFFIEGDKAIVCATPFANIGLSLCYDLRFPHLYRALALAGADLLVVPSAFTKITGALHWETLLRARAIETGCYIVAANQCGKSIDGRETYGHSMIIAPDGAIIDQLGEDEGMLVTRINKDNTKTMREKIGSLFCNPDFKVEICA